MPILATHRLSGPVGRVDTAGAVVFLAGPDVYKVKRAVTFPFMDLSTLDKRREACEAEIAVNRDNAPGVYLEALPIVRNGATLAIGGAGDVVEWVAHLRRFDENATLDRVAERGGLSDAMIDKLALAIRRSHARAPLRDAARAAQELETYIEQNDAAFAEWPDLFPPASARRLSRSSRLAFAVARPVAAGARRFRFHRRCHGDLHLRNIVLIDGEPTLFDAVEFSDEIASGDVLYDLAFLLMDLEERGLRAAANRLFNRYLGPEPPHAMAGLAALPLFLSLRAAIRAKVEAAGAERLEGERRTRRARSPAPISIAPPQFLRYAPPRLIAVGGLSGVGKSALAGALAPRIGRAPGALWLRSDVERKAMFGVEERDHLPDSAYSPDVSREVYRRIDDKARRRAAGGPFGRSRRDLRIGGATARPSLAGPRGRRRLRRHVSRGAARDAARAHRASRRADASDADARVARAQRAEPLRERGWSPMDAAQDRDRKRRRPRGGCGVE